MSIKGISSIILMKFICRKPGPKSVKILERDTKVVSPSLTREYSFVYKKAKGCYIWDVDGRRYLDFSASVAVMNIGHTNPEVGNAIGRQAKLGFHSGFFDFYTELPVQFIETLLGFLPPYLDKCFLSNSGTESVEAAYKLARWHTNKKWVIGFDPCFHGRTMGSLSITYFKKIQRERYDPFLPVKHAPYPYLYRCKFHENNCKNCTNLYLNDLERKIKECRGNLAAIFFEPVSGEGGYIVPPKEFVKGLRGLCNDHDVLLVADEVQAGCYRTGKFLAIDNFNVEPDIVCLGKSICGGIPIGVTLSEKKIMDWPAGSHSNTFGGNLLASAAGIATLDFMKKNKLGRNAQVVGDYIMKRLNEFKEKHELIGDVRGIGLMIGV